MHDASIGDFSPFRREWVIRGRNFGDGQVEVTATRFDRYMGALSLNAMPKKLLRNYGLDLLTFSRGC
ncbi:hypothetical protein BTM_3034 [Burkholderia thailandensis 34]|nr:hypothetical protein BTM_3034 [Burkholderia thailandensis 34]PNE74095.1 hypothetical protein A8H37_19675 [Burkholderia thailandensis]